SVSEGALPPAAAGFAVGSCVALVAIGGDRLGFARRHRFGSGFGGDSLFGAARALPGCGLGRFGFGFRYGFDRRRRIEGFGLGGCLGGFGFRFGLARRALALRLFLGGGCFLGDRFGRFSHLYRRGFDLGSCRLGAFLGIGLLAAAAPAAAARLGFGFLGFRLGGSFDGFGRRGFVFASLDGIGVAFAFLIAFGGVTGFATFLVAAAATAAAAAAAALAALTVAFAFLAALRTRGALVGIVFF